MVKVEHKLRFVTEFDETHPVAQQFLRLDEVSQVYMLESMLKALLAPALKPALDEINANGSYAILKVAE
jgi:NurA-like 5'-3' nuclease